MAALLDGVPATGEYMGVKAISEYAGVSKQAVFGAIARGRLHPVHIAGLSYRVIHRGEVLAWHHRLPWRPTPEDMAVLLAEGYKAEDFTPAVPGEPASPLDTLLGAPGGSSRASASPTPTGVPGGDGGAGGASGAFVSQADVRAFIETVFREGQGVAASAGPLVGSAAQGAMRGWAEVAGASVTPEDVAGVVSGAISGVMRPISETLRDSITPLSEALAQAALPRPAPPAEDAIARQMGALRVELAQLLTRMMDAIRPMVERLAAGGYVTPEDVAPFMALVGELAAGLAGSPFYDLTPRDAPAQMPALLAQLSADTLAASHSPTPAPDAGKE